MMSFRVSNHLTVFNWFLLFILILSTSSHADMSQQVKLDKEAKQLIAEFAKSLKSELSGAIKQGGLENGVEVCSKRATEIASELSVDGWQIKRVSLKNRNLKNAPDAWEETVLNDFDSRIEAGEAPGALYVSKQQELESGLHQTKGVQFRAMKAIPTQPLCLNCHGEQLAPAVYDVIQTHYPQDKATGYTLGEIRGAFSLLKIN